MRHSRVRGNRTSFPRHSAGRSWLVCTVILGAFALAACSEDVAGPASYQATPSFSHGGGTPVSGNPSCTDLGYTYGYKIDEAPSNGSYALTGADFEKVGGGPDLPDESITISNATSTHFDWSSTIPIDGVIVKGGPNALEYPYDPPETEDDGLHAPINSNNGTPYGLSHVEFCINPSVVVEKTAETSFTRTHDWSLEKSSEDTEITADKDGTAVVEYVLDVSYDAYVDDAHQVFGTITVYNPWPDDAIITGVSDDFAGADGDVDVTCYDNADLEGDPIDFDHTLGEGERLYCEYSGDSDGSDGENTATVDVDESSEVGGGIGTADFEFGDPTTVMNECAYVEDFQLGVSEELVACVDDLSEEQLDGTEPLSVDSSVISALAFDVVGHSTVQEAGCDATVQFVNTAGVLGGSADEVGDELDTGSHSLEITTECTNGDEVCTLSQGYWRTHSADGPAPYDETWDALGGGDDLFFDSGQSYHEVLWTAPKGNAYYILAVQYIAAELNGLRGADTSAIDDAFADATDLLNSYDPDDVGAWRGSQGERQAFLDLADTLEQYNTGEIGPGHCDD